MLKKFCDICDKEITLKEKDGFFAFKTINLNTSASTTTTEPKLVRAELDLCEKDADKVKKLFKL